MFLKCGLFERIGRNSPCPPGVCHRLHRIETGMVTRLAPALLMAALLPAAARAQTSDILFGGWSWRSREPGSRPAGLAGAYVAVADSVRTAAINPAGLALIPRIEVSASIGPRWGGLAKRLQRREKDAAPVRPTEAALPVPCPPARRARPWALALYADQPEVQSVSVEVVHGPGLSELGLLEGSAEELGAGAAKGLTPWLDVGATLAWRHLRLDGTSRVVDLLGREQERVTMGGDANKARAIVGALASFGPRSSPTDFRLGVSYQWDLLHWSVDRTRIDRVAGTAGDPERLRIVEPPTLSAGAAWRISDTWLVAGQLDYTWFDRIERQLEGRGGRFIIRDRLEPRAAVEMTRPAPIGGTYKVRMGVRREVSGRAAFEGSDAVLRQAFRGTPAAFRASVGISFLAEFYERGVRLDFDLSQVVLQRQSSLSAAGTRRLAIGITGRL
jgi:hypothetical protein